MIINGTPGNDTLTGAIEDDNISGLGGNDLINGGRGDNIINGGGGNDSITFGAGSHTVNGGAGNDSLDLNFTNETDDIVLTYNIFDEPSSTSGGILDGTTIRSIEEVNFLSGSGNDLIDIATASRDSSLAGGAGNDALIGGLADDTLDGEGGDDTFFGGRGDDEIIGGDGNDAAVFLGSASNYEVALGENSVTVTGAVSDIPEEEVAEGETTLPEPESFTDTLSEVEIILFDNGEIIVETGEYIPFEAGESPDEAPTITEINEEENGEEDEDGISVYRFFRTDTQTQFYTTEEVERDTILDTLPQYELEGISFVGATPPPEEGDITGISPVYRLFNTSTGVHLYTADENERNFVEENLDNYVAEGAPYYGYDTQVEGTVPLYRFYNQSLDAHFYTPSTEERDAFIESPDYEPEGGGDGIAFYVEPVSEL